MFRIWDHHKIFLVQTDKAFAEIYGLVDCFNQIAEQVVSLLMIGGRS